ncbi:MAG TPA: 4-hydroxy-tetrahydrodipicolinate synthase [Phycisphaerae bacterium]|nr:4-hydroxy-tetrahydrodipicolinate synthase [Phycisphaerae bacterium]HRR83636.1 4-hydroxy-tetrahydrodipicolinate synthase [Phycisphaerae bacterium]
MFKGSMVALVTPYANGEVDWKTLDALVDFHLDSGTEVLVPCGTTGESPTLTHEENDAVIAAVVRRAKGRVAVLAGTGSNSTAEALVMTRNALKNGADGALLVVPYYNRPTQEGLFQHFSTLAKAADFPQVLYNIPGRCGTELSVDTIVRLRETHKNIVAVKHATGSMDGASELRVRSDIDIISGDDSMTLPLMSIGGVGVISVLANIVPKDVKALTDAALRGDWETARKWHLKMFKLAKGLLTLEVNPIPIKTAMAIKGMLTEEFRLPLCPMSPANRERLLAVMKEYGL